MKAILVIDNPTSCEHCAMCQSTTYSGGKVYCNECFAEHLTAWKETDGDKPSWCPLKPMPRKLDANDWHRMFGGKYKEREAKGYGWNACLDEITGETE